MCQKCHACDCASDYGVCTLLYNCVICMKHIQVVLLCHEMMTDEEGNTGKVRKGSWWQVVLLCDDSDDRSEGKCREGQKG